MGLAKPSTDRWSGLQHPLLGTLDVGHELGHEADSSGKAAQAVGAGAELAELKLAAIEAVMDVGVNVAADDAAAGHGQHREQRHVAVGGAGAEITVIQDGQRPGYAEHHVEAEPARRRAEELEPRTALAQRIRQKHENEAQ